MSVISVRSLCSVGLHDDYWSVSVDILIDQYMEKVESILHEELNVVVPSRDSDLFSGGYIDSLLLMDLLFLLEKEFNISVKFADLDFDDFKNIINIASFVQNQLGSDRAVG